ncbi:uncharacterized protein LOC144445792 [Glandiceps talaboti]
METSSGNTSQLVSDEEFMSYQETDTMKAGFTSKTKYGAVNMSSLTSQGKVTFVYRPTEEDEDNLSITHFETDEDVLSDILSSNCQTDPETDSDDELRNHTGSDVIPLTADYKEESSLTLSQKLLLLILCIDKFVNQCTQYFLIPFLPLFALHKEVTPLVISVVFSSISVAGFIVAVPMKNVVSMQYLFMCTAYYVGPGWFPALIAILRFIDGIAVTIFQTATLTLCYNEFPVSYIASIMALIEVAAVLGFCAAPILGGSLYYVGGFQLPFLVMGGILVIILFPANAVVVPNDNEDSTISAEFLPLKKVITNIEFVMLSIVFFVVIFTISFFQPIIAFHLNEMGRNPIQIGCIIALFPVCFGVGTVVFGILSQTDSVSKPIIVVVGLLIQFIGAMCMGPNPGLWFINR